MAAVKHWHSGIAVILALSFIHVHLSDGTIGPDIFDLLRMCRKGSIPWEPLALIPQAVLYRNFRQVQGMTGGSFLLLMGLYRVCYVANWIVRVNTEPGYKHDILLSIAAVAQVSISARGIIWPAGVRERDLTVLC